MEKPLVSFIIPIYNVAPYLEKCISSVLNQSFGDYEIIAVNDGSPDNCGAILEELSGRDSRVRVVTKRNGGLSSARNAGIAASKGSWLYFLDGDDSLLPDSIGNVIPYLGDRYDVVMTDVGSADQHSEENGVRVAISNDLDLAGEFDTIGWTVFSACGKFYRKEVLTQNNLWFDEKMIGNEDQAFELSLLGGTNRLPVLNNQTYDYNIHAGSISHTTRDPRVEMGIYEYYCRYLDKNPVIVESSVLFCNMFVGYAVYKRLEGLSLDRKAAEMRKVMANPFVIQALSKVSFTQKDKMLVCRCIRKKTTTSLIVLFRLKNAARKAMPVFDCVKKLTR